MRHNETLAIRRALRAEKWLEAKSLISIQLRQFPGEPWLLVNLAYVHQMEGKAHKAMCLLDKVHRESHKDPFITWAYADLLTSLGHHEKGLRLLRQILRWNIDPSCSIETGTGKRRAKGFINDCRFRAGLCCFRLDRPGPAIRYLEEYIDFRDQGVSSLYTKKAARDIVETLKNVEFLDKARATKKTVTHFRRVIRQELRKDPKSCWLLTWLSYTYTIQDKYRQALRLAERALELQPGDAWAMWIYALCLEGFERNEEAIKLYKKILRKGLDATARGQTRRWARMLLNDCRACIGMCYYVMLRNKLATRWITKHLRNRRRNDESAYSAEGLRNVLAELREED